MLAVVLLQLAAPAAGPPPPDCSAAEHRQLDFWLGRWTVTDAKTGLLAGASTITPIYKGCAVQETFEDPNGFVGGSLNMWDRARREWVQFGTGSTGARRLFTGRWDGVKLSLLTDQPRPDAPTFADPHEPAAVGGRRGSAMVGGLGGPRRHLARALRLHLPTGGVTPTSRGLTRPALARLLVYPAPND